MKNIIQTKFTDTDHKEIDVHISKLESLLKGKLEALTEEQRVRYGSINEQNKLFVRKVYDYRQSSSDLSAPEVDWKEFEKDFQARNFLETRLDKLRSLAYQMESTKMMHDYDNYRDALLDYGYAQYKRGAGANGYTEKVAELKQFFPRLRKNGENGAGAESV
ncbi:hypothetical protein [Sinomicrobium sp. M5D2P9]